MYWRTLDLDVNTNLKLSPGTMSPAHRLTLEAALRCWERHGHKLQDGRSAGVVQMIGRWTWGSNCCSGRRSLQLHLHQWTTLIKLPLWVNEVMPLHGTALLGGVPGSYGTLYTGHVSDYMQDMSCPQEEKL